MKSLFTPFVVVFLLQFAGSAEARKQPLLYAADVGVVSSLGAVAGVGAVAPAPVPLATPIVLPRMAPELALNTYWRHSDEQAAELAAYTAKSVITAELPETAQHGEFEVERHYAAPHTLEFRALKFVGDAFVKTNVITRLLQSEVDHMQKDDPSQTAISPANYKFSYKGDSQINGRLVHAYQVKPHKKRAGLFKGRIYLDARTGTLARAEGTTSKSPSLFVKKIEFVQDYADFGAFTLPVHMHSEARARIVGRTIVDVEHRDYQPVAAALRSGTQIPSF